MFHPRKKGKTANASILSAKSPQSFDGRTRAGVE
jgi:hypothetical protein